MLNDYLSDMMTTEEIFRAWDEFLSIGSDILASVKARLEESGFDEDIDELTEEQDKLLGLRESLEGIGIM